MDGHRHSVRGPKVSEAGRTVPHDAGPTSRVLAMTASFSDARPLPAGSEASPSRRPGRSEARWRETLRRTPYLLPVPVPSSYRIVR